MIRSLSEFRFFKSFRIPIESSDDIQFSVEKDDLYGERGEFIRDAKMSDVSITGIGFYSASKLSIGDTVNISIHYRRLRFDISASIVRAFSGHIDNEKMSYGAEIDDSEDRTKMNRFLSQLITHFSQERLKGSLKNLALSENYSDLNEGFEMFSLMLSLFKDITNFASQEGFIDSMLEEATRILNSQRAVVYLINTETNQLEAGHSVGVDKKRLRFDYRKGVAGSVFTTGISLNIDSGHEKLKFYETIDKKLDVQTHSVICNPITNREDKVIGVLEIVNKRNQPRFTEDDEKVMKMLSLVFSCFFSQYNPISKKSLIRRFSAPCARNLVWIGKSQHTTDLRRNILKLKDISTPICIEGEKGVGKSLYAHILHAEGARGINEIYEVDCLTTKAEEFDELFWGSAKGPGIFSVCKDGSVVFREVKEISLKGQEKILSEFMGKNPNSNRLRFFFTSSISLDDLREDGVISQDFYTFINQNIVEIKPLRERKKDIEELVDYFLSRECKDQGFLQKVFSDKIKDSLVEYEWQGNTSELKTAIARLVRYNPKSHVIVEVEDSILPILKAPVNSRISSEIAHVNDHTLHLKDRILLVEYEMIKAEIKRHKGNKSQAAISMGISREALRKKLMNCESITTKVEEVVRNKRKSNIDEKTRVINLADLKKAA